jgi:hypothetical protein
MFANDRDALLTLATILVALSIALAAIAVHLSLKAPSLPAPKAAAHLSENRPVSGVTVRTSGDTGVQTSFPVFQLFDTSAT